MNIPTEIVERLLRHWPVAHLATITPSGHPHVVPIVFCALQGFVYSPHDGKRKAGSKRLQRFLNITDHPRVSLLIDRYDPDWNALWWVRFDATAEVEVPPIGERKAIKAELISKYPQYAGTAFQGALQTFLCMRIERITGWSQSGDTTIIEESVSAYAGRSA